MAIKSYNKVQYIAPDGTVTNGTYPKKIGSFLFETNSIIFRDGKTIPKLNRAVCTCGYVDKYEDRPTTCVKCGAKFDLVLNQKSWTNNANSDFAPILFDTESFVKNNSILVPQIEILLSPVTSSIQISESYSEVFEKKSDQPHKIISNFQSWPKEKLQIIEPLVEEIMVDDYLWELTTKKLDEVWNEISVRYKIGINEYQPLVRKISLYNHYTMYPWTQNVSASYIASILEKNRFNPHPSLFSATEDEFLDQIKQPKFLRDLYPHYGFIRRDTRCLDFLDEKMKNAVRYAIIHHHSEMKYVDEEIGIDSYGYSTVDQINLFAEEYAEFFRKSVIEFGTETWSNFKLLKNSGQSSFKDLNVLQMEKYLASKKFKAEKIKQFESLIDSGDYLGAVKLIASGRN